MKVCRAIFTGDLRFNASPVVFQLDIEKKEFIDQEFETYGDNKETYIPIAYDYEDVCLDKSFIIVILDNVFEDAIGIQEDDEEGWEIIKGGKLKRLERVRDFILFGE